MRGHAFEHCLNRRSLIIGAVGGALLTGGVQFGEAGAQDATVPAGGSLTLYNGQHAETTQAMVDAFTAKTGIKVEFRSGEGAELANQIVAEGDGSPADLFFTENSPNL